MAVLQKIIHFADEANVHCVRHSVFKTHRGYLCRVVWLLLLLSFFLFCLYMQMSLVYTIAIVKPQTVDHGFKRAEKMDFPNIVLCDLAPEQDKLFKFFAPMGNIGLLMQHMGQISKSYLFEVVRNEMKSNLSAVFVKYPKLEENHVSAGALADPSWLSLIG